MTRPLPDVPEDEYRQFSANQFAQQNQARIDQFNFMHTNQQRIAGLQGLGMPGFETPEIASTSVIQANPQLQLPPLPTPQLPAMPQLPLGTPAPMPAPQPLPEPAPMPQQPIIGATPAPMTITPNVEQPVSTPTQPGQPRILGGATTPPSAAELTPPAPPGGPPDINGPARPVWGDSAPTTTTTPSAPKQNITQPIDSTSRATFATSVAPYAQYAAEKLGIDPTWVAAMMGSESNFGKAPGNELFGVKALPGQKSQSMATHEGEYGGTNVNQDFAIYDTPLESVDAWVNLIKNHYPGAVGAKDLPTFVHGLKSGGYFTAAEPEYLGILSDIKGQLQGNVTAALQNGAQIPSSTSSQTVAQPARVAQTAMNQSQFGDSELTAAEAYAACGPAAAVRFAQAYGRNPTLREATDLAASVGWTPGSGMAGIGSEQKLMTKLGIPTKLVGADPSAIAAEAQTGNPVTISTPGHYFLADGYNPQTGQFHVGRSGLDLKSGAEWMTLEQMQNLMGPVQGALFADNPSVQSNSSTQTDTLAPLDNLKQKATSIFSDFAQQTPFSTRLPQSSDPQVQQLNRAVEIAHIPTPSQAPTSDVTGMTSAASDNPLANLGNVIGNAISNALQSAFGGGPPGGNDRRAWDPTQQQDQTDQPQDVGSRSRRMIEQIQTLPGGMKLGDIVGAPDLLPPDWDKLKNESPADALQEMMERGNQLANISRPSIGPGGLGIVDPRLGNDPRMDVPDVIEPISRLGGFLGDLVGEGERGAGRVSRALDDVFEREAAASGRELTGGVSQDALDSLRTAGDILESNADMPMLDIAREGRESLGKSLSRTRWEQAWDATVRQLTDSGTDLNNIEKEMAARKGAPLTDAERVGLLARVDPTHQASTAFDENVGGALRDIRQAGSGFLGRGGDEALNDFYGLVEHRTNQSVAEGLAKQVEQDYLKGGIPDNVTSRLNEANAELDRAQSAHAQALADQRAVDAGSGYRTRQSIGLDSAGQRVQSAEADLAAAREHAVDAAAAARHEATMRGSQGELVRRPEQKDLIIAENDAKRAQARFERLAMRDESVPIAPQGQNNAVRRRYEQQVATAARQAGYAQDRVTRLRDALGANTATREANVTAKAEQAAQASRDAGRVAQTPELAAAKVRLQYEQKNLDRLQAAKARGQQGLVDDLARAYRKVQKAQRDVDQATKDLPEAARAQGWAQLHGRTFSGPGGKAINYDDVMQAQKDIRAKYADKPKVLEAFDKGLEAIQNHRRMQLQEAVDHGVISQSDMDTLLDRYDFWTPTRIMDYMSDDRPNIGMGGGNRFNVNNPGMLSYTPEGTAAEHENHVAALLRDTYEHKNRIAKNDVSSALIDGFGADKGVMNKVAQTVKEYEDSGRTILPPDYSLKNNEARITALRDGKRVDYVTSNDLLKRAIEQVNGNGDPLALANLAMYPAKLVRELAVQRNPAFVPVNLARDTIAFALRNMAEAGVGGNLSSLALNAGPAALTAAETDPNDPNRGQKIAAALGLGMGGRMALGKNLGLGPSAMRAYLGGIADSMQGLGSGRLTGSGVRELERLGGGMRGGGFFSSAVGRGPAAAEKELQGITRGNAMTIRNGDDLKQVLGDIAGFGWSKALGNRLEQAPRVATMRMALDRGVSPLEAMIKARDVTTDFNRGGKLSRELNRYVPFFNVGMQAPAQLGRLLHDHPGGAMMAGLSLLGAPAAATEAWNYSDPQRAQDYEDVPDYLKKMGIVLMAPGEAPRDAQGNRVPQKFFLPIPNEFMPFVEGGREGFHRVQDLRGAANQGQPRSAGDLVKTLASELSPGQLDSPEGAIYGQIPAPFGTIGQLAANKDWFRGSTIANQYSDENASNFSKALAPILTDLITQLPEHQLDKIHPSHIDFAIKDALSGPGQQFLNATDALSGRESRVPGAVTETPGVGSILGRFVRGTGGQLLADARQETLTPSAARALREAGIDWQPSLARGDIQKMPLLQSEQAKLQQLTNRYMDDALQRVIRSSRWDGYSKANKQKLVDMASSAGRQKAEAEVMKGIPLADRHARVRAAAAKA